MLGIIKPYLFFCLMAPSMFTKQYCNLYSKWKYQVIMILKFENFQNQVLSFVNTTIVNKVTVSSYICKTMSLNSNYEYWW